MTTPTETEQAQVIVIERPSWGHASFFARITLAGETICECPHSHSRRELAQRCGARLLAATTVTPID